ncbi:MAG: hypothetical protein L0H10_03845 [Comamonas sp.]|nr:hypothetical protein [Comamonas sp.]MDN5535664.1 hypothetical protein [Comamonas sp.]
MASELGAIQYCALLFVDGSHVLLHLWLCLHRICREDSRQLCRTHSFAGISVAGIGGDVLQRNSRVLDRELHSLLTLFTHGVVLFVELLLVNLFDQADGLRIRTAWRLATASREHGDSRTDATYKSLSHHSSLLLYVFYTTQILA